MIRALSCLLLLAASTTTVLHAQSGTKGTAPKPAASKAKSDAAAKKETPKKKSIPSKPKSTPAKKTEPPKPAPTSSAVTTAAEPVKTERRLETLLLMPEPKAMRNAYSIVPAGAQQTVFTPYRESAVSPNGIEPYTQESFSKLGLGVETFAQRAKLAADKRLLQLRPELIKGDDGKIAYAVYRGESSLYPTLLIAPSLPGIFADLFGKEIWAAMPDRHSLYIFPANPDLLQAFAPDLAERYSTDPYAASCEVFSLKTGEEPAVVASFVEVQ